MQESPNNAFHLPRNAWVYSRDRDLTRKILEIHYGQKPVKLEPPLMSLGVSTDFYLRSHGYNTDAQLYITQALIYSDSEEEFISLLVVYGAPVAELEFIWWLYHSTPREQQDV